MRITVGGAAGEVTGSCTSVETTRSRLLVDFGMFQGRGATERRNRDLGPIAPARLDGVVLTHAHLDHCGRLPLLVARGLRSRIFATPATIDVARIILEDSARLQQADTRRISRRRLRAGRRPVEPLYDEADVAATLQHFEALDYDTRREVAPGIYARLVDAGHILGSASVELRIQEGDRETTLVFSGDLGVRGAPFLRDPTPLEGADLVVMESTYGDRDHRPRSETVDQLRDVLRQAIEHRARVLIPAFAIGRAQEVLYEIAQLVRSGAIPSIPIFLDSPMAIDALALYARHHLLFDDEAASLARGGRILRSLTHLTFCETAEQSKALNDAEGPLVILAGSGMCDGGRIVHHLKHSLWRPETQVVIVGYQAAGSLGRALVDGAREVRVLGERIAVKARIHTLGGFSAHAGRAELLDWAEPLARSGARFILTHGEPAARDALRDALRDRFGATVACPALGEVVEHP
ncbi:MAG: MBL fold metallo-hydrolase [Isosphaeraceae bacterium]